MARIRVGYRRLYDAAGCSHGNQEPLTAQYKLPGSITADVCIGYPPRFGICVQRTERYLVPGERASLIELKCEQDAAKSAYPRKYFTEVCCWEELDLDDTLTDALARRERDAPNALFQCDIVLDHQDMLKACVDVVVGTLALRFHPQFALILVCEGLVAMTPALEHPVKNFVSEAVEILEPVRLRDGAGRRLAQLEVPVQAAAGILKRASGVMFWLIRAWSEQDALTKFMALFTPMEMSLAGIGEASDTGRDGLDATIRELIAGHQGTERERLLARFDHLAGADRPSLSDRFRMLARQAGMPGWEEDAAAFQKFNKVRNAIIHRGEPKAELVADVGAEEVRQLRDIVERYVCYRLFGDGDVYRSNHRWTKRPQMGA